jgi:predicted permease
MATLLQDLRHSIRQLLRTPLFTATAVLTLAIGMGVNTVAFAVVNGFLFKGYALKGIPGVGRLVTTPGGDESGYASLPEYERFADATAGALDLAAEGRSSIGWRHDGITDTAWVLYVSRNYFSIVDAPMLAGRRAVERSGAAVSAIIGERFWREKLGSPALTGLTLRLNDVDVSVAGIVDGSFTGPAGIYSPDSWLPLDDLALFGSAPVMEQRDSRWLFLMGRLLDGATQAAVHGRVQSAAVDMTRDWPDTHRDRGAAFRMLEGGGGEVRAVTTAAAIGMGIIGLVLLLACFNVANLLLARAAERERDMGIRSALGARPSRLIRLVVTEGVVIAVLSGAVALMLAWWTQPLVGSFAIPIEQPQHIDFTPDWRVALFISTLIGVTGVLPGVWPALAAARVDVLKVLGSQGGSSAGGRPSRLRRWLVGAQIAGSTAFLAMTALFLQSYGRIASLDLGFARDEIVIADFDPTRHGFTAAEAERFMRAFGERVRALPGVGGAALVDHAPFFVGFNRTTVVWPPGRACDDGTCRSYPTYGISPGYLRTMGITVAEGREFAADGARGEVVINGLLAKTLWPDRSAVGETLRIGDAGESVTVVGVTAMMRTRGLDRETPVIFVPIGDTHYAEGVSLVVRTATPIGAIRSITDAAAEIDPHVALTAVKTMDQRMAVQAWPFLTLSRMFAICGTLALILATVGLAGVVIHAVNRRIREFGVRLSIGATRRDLVAEVLAGGVRLLVPGLVAGLLLAAGVAQLIRLMFLGVNVLNPLTYLAVAAVQSLTVLLACVGPAIRASRVDPLVALRSE